MAIPQETIRLYDFGPFRINGVERILLRDGEIVPLTPKQFDILLVLVENRGHVVEKERLMQEIWPGTAVEEGNLTTNISTLRKALEEGSNEQRYIQTLPRRGYRFVGQVTEAADDQAGRIAQVIEKENEERPEEGVRRAMQQRIRAAGCDRRADSRSAGAPTDQRREKATR